MKKSFKVSTTAQRKAALALVIKKVTRGQIVGDNEPRTRYGVSGIVTRLKAQGFITATEKRGVYAGSESLTTWKAEEILDLLYRNKNAKERKVLARLEREPEAAPATTQELFTPAQAPVPDPSGMTWTPVMNGLERGELVQDPMAIKIQAALTLAERYNVKNLAQFIADYLREQKQ